MCKIALIPSYQPDEKLVELTEKLSGKGYMIFIVDDGSGGDYSEIFESAKRFKGVKVLSYKNNRGKGHALKYGIKCISTVVKPPYVIVTLDSDGQHSIEDAEKVYKRAKDNRDCLIIGSRAFDNDVPFKSRFGNTMTRYIFRLKAGLRIRDTQTGLRGFSDSMTDRILKISGERYEYEMRMLVRFAKDGVPMIEEPIKTIYIDDNSGSHFDPLRDSARVYKALLF